MAGKRPAGQSKAAADALEQAKAVDKMRESLEGFKAHSHTAVPTKTSDETAQDIKAAAIAACGAVLRAQPELLIDMELQHVPGLAKMHRREEYSVATHPMLAEKPEEGERAGTTRSHIRHFAREYICCLYCIPSPALDRLIETVTAGLETMFDPDCTPLALRLRVLKTKYKGLYLEITTGLKNHSASSRFIPPVVRSGKNMEDNRAVVFTQIICLHLLTCGGTSTSVNLRTLLSFTAMGSLFDIMRCEAATYDTSKNTIFATLIDYAVHHDVHMMKPDFFPFRSRLPDGNTTVDMNWASGELIQDVDGFVAKVAELTSARCVMINATSYKTETPSSAALIGTSAPWNPAAPNATLSEWHPRAPTSVVGSGLSVISASILPGDSASNVGTRITTPSGYTSPSTGIQYAALSHRLRGACYNCGLKSHAMSGCRFQRDPKFNEKEPMLLIHQVNAGGVEFQKAHKPS